jgi:hypothetical protein
VLESDGTLSSYLESEMGQLLNAADAFVEGGFGGIGLGSSIQQGSGLGGFIGPGAMAPDLLGIPLVYEVCDANGWIGPGLLSFPNLSYLSINLWSQDYIFQDFPQNQA